MLTQPTQLLHRLLRTCAALCLLALALPARADCTISSLTYLDAVRDVLKRNKEEYTLRTKQHLDYVCNKLQEADARVFLLGHHGVALDRAYGWVSVSVADKEDENLIVHLYSHNAMRMHETSTQAKAREMLWLSINDALDWWWYNPGNLDKALVELEKARRYR